MIKMKGAICVITLFLILVGARIFDVTRLKTMEPSGVTNNKMSSDKDAIKTIFYGEWLVSDYVSTAELFDLNPVPEGYNSPPDKDFENLKIVFDDRTIINFSDPSELGFEYKDAEELNLGYILPLSLKGPITYVCIQHINFDQPIDFIQDSEKHTYIGIDYNYYKLVKLHG